MKNKIYISIGTNIGNRLDNIKKCLEILNRNKISIQKISSVYESEPVGKVKQQNFYNIVVQINSRLTPEKLLIKCQTIENEMGRKRSIKWGPRIIDIDIILYNKKIINTKKLKVPHPEMLNRKFVLLPLLEIEPEIVYPVNNTKISDIYKQSCKKKIFKSQVIKKIYRIIL